jgi:hypothetical protein
MYMIFLHMERAYRPGVRFADVTDFPFDKWSKLANQNLFALFRTPDKVVSKLVGNLFGVLHLHTYQYNICSNSCGALVGAALPPLER